MFSAVSNSKRVDFGTLDFGICLRVENFADTMLELLHKVLDGAD
jgi:hypothetical protein